jgi:hypothetical protein
VSGEQQGAKGKGQEYHSATMTEVTLTTIYEEAEEGGYIGYVAECPERTLKERLWRKCART